MGRHRQEPVMDPLRHHAGPCPVCKGSGMVSASRYGFCGPAQLPCPKCRPVRSENMEAAAVRKAAGV